MHISYLAPQLYSSSIALEQTSCYQNRITYFKQRIYSQLPLTCLMSIQTWANAIAVWDYACPTSCLLNYVAYELGLSVAGNMFDEMTGRASIANETLASVVSTFSPA